MIEFIDPNSNKLVSSGPTMSRKAYYIHGTTSDNDRWSKYSSTVQQLNRIAFGIGVDKNDTEGINDMGSEKFKKACCDFSFEWGNNGILKVGNNWFLNTVEDRRIASEKLIEHINGNIGKCEEIVLIGHSHGGNVAIQAADKIFSKIPTVKRLFVLTIGTPAFNRLFITSYINNKNFITFNEKVSEKIPYLGKDYVIPVMKLGRKFWGPLGIFLYINCENPATWKNKDKITHIALWNKKDYVDDMAWVLDRNKYFPYHGMTNNSAYFTNSITDNVEFDFAPADIRDYYKREIKPFAEWLANLDYLRFCLVDLRLKGYDLPKMPALLEGGSIDKIMTKKIDLGILSNVNQAFVTLNTLSSVYLKFMAEDEKYLVKYIEWLNSYTIKDLKIDGKIEKFFVVKNADLSELIHSNKGTLETGTTIINTNKRRHQLKAICVSKGKQVRLLEPNPKITLMEKVELSSKDKKKVQLLKKIVDNSSFQAFCLLLSAVNLAMACNDASRNGIDKKKIFSIGASLTEVTSIGINYAGLLLKGTERAQILLKASQGLGVISSIFGIITSSYEAADAFNKRNSNLGYAWVASAAVSALILKVYITEMFKTSAVTLIKKPSGKMVGQLAIFWVLTFACMYFIILFTETPIESLIHNCILNDRTKKYIPKSETDICKLMKLLIVNQEKIVSADRWKGNISLQLEDLLSILFINVINPEIKTDKTLCPYGTAIIERERIKEIILKCSFPKVRFDCYIEYGLKIYQNLNNVVKLYKDILLSDEPEFSANENITLYYTESLGSIPFSDPGYKVAFFYVRILFPYEKENNNCWPKKVEGKDMYLVRRFKLEEARAISTPIILDKFFRDTFDFLDYCSKRSIDVCTLDDLSLKV